MIKRDLLERVEKDLDFDEDFDGFFFVICVLLLVCGFDLVGISKKGFCFELLKFFFGVYFVFFFVCRFF